MELTQFEVDFENWRPFVGSCGKYVVSDLGRVRNVSRTNVLTGNPDIGGYLRVGIKTDRLRIMAVHVAVLKAFVGPCPPGMQCRHRDGNKTNNRLSNLRWGTPAENAEDAKRHMSHFVLFRRPHPHLSDEDVSDIRSRRESVRAAMARYGVSLVTVSRIRSGQSRSGKPRRSRPPGYISPRSALSRDEIVAIRASTERLRVVAARYGVAIATVHEIRKLKSFQNIT